ncbi:RagB/SusD family nutrient uptake outer membrane protein [Bacteroides sp. 51]|uniref:RagB/SusD family nutrient uptake outer membrane protein n=1 Tax=Bacteroides sp. 51 TaxID=2302938 RepID=UPI0013D17E32|nr:RagB/SusD family nutrient uptake outer membrane protein [Bacteroides sp. 51]NDV84643.1 RagB/SusD family nutrient uptake outer membrane protein [Bacteroides sp. 51]
MKKVYIKSKIMVMALTSVVGSSLLFNSCSESFLEPDPLSFYEPESTFTTESGLKAALAVADRHLRSYWMNVSANTNSVVAGTELMFSDLAVYGKTDANVGSVNFDVATGLTPTGGASGPGGNDGNYINHFWAETYTGIKYANTILSYVDKVTTLDEATKNMYKGRAYFHRAYRYMGLVFQYGDVPLVTKILEVPKQNYRSTKKEAILEMITADMEKAVEWVPEQADMTYIGMVNKGACKMLLAKCYLATGQYKKAKDLLDVIISSSGYALMENQFGAFNPGGEPETWPIDRNVIWDLHRPENKLIAANKEVIMGIPDRGADSFIEFKTMRIFGPLWQNGNLKSPDGKTVEKYARNNGNYRKDLDWTRAIGRGIGTFRPTYFAQQKLWVVNGVEDEDDLRHNTTVGNWVKMTSLKYNHASDAYRGKNLMLYSDKDIYNDKGEITMRKGDLLCQDTIRSWFDFPHYKHFLNDVVREADMGAVDFDGATKGGTADWYLYRLAEAYLLRAEAKFYLDDATAVDDVNAIRKRAKCSQLYSGKVTIGDIMDERARELYMEEWRNMELTRVSYCLALSGKPDEWGNTYDSTWDKHSGTEVGVNTPSSYWYKRVTLCGAMYNKGPIRSANKEINYRMDKRNVYWPIPDSAIRANKRGKLAQNYGYDGYDANVPMWETWQEAVADEELTD